MSGEAAERPSERLARLEKGEEAMAAAIQDLGRKVDRLQWAIVGFALVSGLFQYLQAGSPGSDKAEAAMIDVAAVVLRLTGLG